MYLKCSNSNVYNKKNSAKQTSGRLLVLLLREEIFKINVLFCLSYGGKFAFMKFADWLT